MQSSTAPSISITPKGQKPSQDIGRVQLRVKRLRQSLEKYSISDEKRGKLKASLEENLAILDHAKKMLEV